MVQSIPEPIQPVLHDYVNGLKEHCPDLEYNFYIVGSIALGEFNEYFSDIDFVTILPRWLSNLELKSLQLIHKYVERRHRQFKLSGSYIQTSDLGKINSFIAPHPFYNDGVLHPHGLTEINLVTWWELKNFGIPVVGVNPQALPINVDWDLLLEKMRENMNSYWYGWTTQPKRIVTLYSDWGIQWAVTGVLRQFYTFRENTITTKIRASQYALGCLPERWHPLIQEAINIRERQKKSFYSSKIMRAVDAIRFMKFVIETCNSDSP